jgi:hypothetical protein
MSGQDEQVSDNQPLNGTGQALAIARSAMSGRRWLAVALGVGFVVLAGIIAPGDAPGTWVWTRVIVATLLAAVPLAAIDGFRSDPAGHPTPSPLVMWSGLVLAVAISLTFSVLTAALALIVLVPLLLQASGRRAPRGILLWGLVVTLTPLWVWSAFEAWDRWLLMLVPIAAIGTISLEHALRAALSADSHLAELRASWIGVLGMAAALLAIALLSDIDPSWVTLGAAGATVLAGIDFALPDSMRDRLPSFALPALALLGLTLSWLTAL